MNDKNKITQFREEIDQILWKDWDPIGVNDTPEAEGEYTSYADQICSQLINTKQDKQGILDYLFWVETSLMGFGNGDANQKIIDSKNSPVAEKILNAFSNYR
jgi:hypothetical protein